MLGYSVSYFLSQYWRNVPLYAEKLIPLLDTCLSNNFVYSDKVSGAFYELINKYQNTAELPLENLKEFIRENGYGYILDLMIQDEDNIKMLWYLLVLIHQLKGSREGLELVLSLFSAEGDRDPVDVFDVQGDPAISLLDEHSIIDNTNLLTKPLNVVGACPIGSGGTFTYVLPEGHHITEVGTYKLQFTNVSYNSLGKLNSIKFIAHKANLEDIVLCEFNNLLFNYPAKTYEATFDVYTSEEIISITAEYECDDVNQIGACIAGIKITKDDTTYLPIEDGLISTKSDFYIDHEARYAFEEYSITGTEPKNAGGMLIEVGNLEAGTYTMTWNLLGGDISTTSEKESFYITDIDVSLRYIGYDEADKKDKPLYTLDVCDLHNLPYQITNKEYSITFRALQNVKDIVFSYKLNGSGDNAYNLDTSKIKAYISDLRLYKDSNTITIKTIPDMTSETIPSGNVYSTGTFTEGGKDYKAFNYTSPIGCTPTSSGSVRYVYKEDERPSAGDYTFVWSNNSTNNNGYLTSMQAKIIYTNDYEETIYLNNSLYPTQGKEKIATAFTATNTIKELVLTYTTTLDENMRGGTFQEVNIIKTVDGVANGSKIDVWHEPLPVNTENTFSVESEVDVNKTGTEFFYNFRNFVRNYVYPELEALKVKYSLEGAQAMQVYNVEEISYESFCEWDPD